MKYLFVIIFMGCIAATCGKDYNQSCRDSVCTMEFATIGVNLIQNGSPASIDSYITKRVEDGQIINIQNRLSAYEDSLYRSQGYYPVLSDLEMMLTDRQGKAFVFIGTRNNVEVVRQEFKMNHDCCHVKRQSGPEQINL